MKSIVLIGMMGSGKSTLGKLLAQQLGLAFIDIDSVIEKKEQMSVSEIFAQKSEAYFREVEKSTILSVFKPENLVISLGGGAFENSETRDYLLQNAKVIYLKTTPQTIFERIKNDNSRPLLYGKMSVEHISDIINKRKTNYESAHLTVETDNKTPAKIIREILK